ncbi:hypothetical protein CSB92_5952 [Pseudomonas aeruginosa]|nr:hypothetical protein CSC30_0427 [Pseudomonas aeruginosa]EYU03008.1 hypothetical protein PA103_4908 [Pseudomonas aeruginosa PA103]AWF64944.1 hypothetical protein CSC27_2689 [Pseudomonas aeruginosa]AWZ87122.1 hypothetical protein CSC41_4681 [Pseudomonas aeruginosa]AZP60603.1 Uncharacterized protein PA1840_3411 [Pseudomonas aeruginosa]
MDSTQVRRSGPGAARLVPMGTSATGGSRGDEALATVWPSALGRQWDVVAPVCNRALPGMPGDPGGRWAAGACRARGGSRSREAVKTAGGDTNRVGSGADTASIPLRIAGLLCAAPMGFRLTVRA